MLFCLSCRCAVFHVPELRGEAQGIVGSCLKSLSWWGGLYTAAPNLLSRGSWGKQIIHGIRELLYFVYGTLCWTWQPQNVHWGSGYWGLALSEWHHNIPVFRGHSGVQSLYLPLQLSPKTGDLFCCCCPKPQCLNWAPVRECQECLAVIFYPLPPTL